jgi:myosin-5
MLNVDEAGYGRDSFSKFVYGILFNWIVTKINETLSGNNSQLKSESVSQIGVLDIFGFETFEENSLEQLCINYANEVLQDHFNIAVFQSENELYSNEGIDDWQAVEYPDNSVRVHLLQKVFALCDAATLASTFGPNLAATLYTNSKNDVFGFTQEQKHLFKFSIQHFAGRVTYNAVKFVEKNRNVVAIEFFECLHNSSNDFVRSIVDKFSQPPTVKPFLRSENMRKPIIKSLQYLASSLFN